jgi:DMSO reductase family type II enzyme heme b subunit
MKKELDLIAAPTGMQPGGYVPVVYSDRDGSKTPSATVEAEHSTRGWRFRIAWPCPEPARDIGGESDRFPDAAAIVAPAVPEAPWVTMGAPGQAIAGFLWRADREELLSVRAEGLGTVQRGEASGIRRLNSEWSAGEWSVAFDVADWKELDATRRFAVAIWRGAARERAGLKSISAGWIEVTT